MSITVAIKRCKGCIFWQRYHGEIANPVMRRLHGDVAPGRKQHACVLRLREPDSEKPQPSFNPKDAPGPNYGKRTGPNAVCDFHTEGRQPYRKPGPIETPLADQPFDESPQLGFDPPALESELRAVEFV